MVRKNIELKRPQMAAETSASGRNECDTIYNAYVSVEGIQTHKAGFNTFNVGRGSNWHVLHRDF